MTNKEIVKDKIRGDVEREQALEEAYEMARLAGKDIPKEFGGDDEILAWASMG